MVSFCHSKGISNGYKNVKWGESKENVEMKLKLGSGRLMQNGKNDTYEHVNEMGDITQITYHNGNEFRAIYIEPKITYAALDKFVASFKEKYGDPLFDVPYIEDLSKLSHRILTWKSKQTEIALDYVEKAAYCNELRKSSGEFVDCNSIDVYKELLPVCVLYESLKIKILIDIERKKDQTGITDKTLNKYKDEF